MDWSIFKWVFSILLILMIIISLFQEDLELSFFEMIGGAIVSSVLLSFFITLIISFPINLYEAYQIDKEKQKKDQVIKMESVDNTYTTDIYQQDSNNKNQNTNPSDYNFVKPHEVEGYWVEGHWRGDNWIDGYWVDSYWRDGDGDTSVDRSVKEGGGYWRQNPGSNQVNQDDFDFGIVDSLVDVFK